MSGDAEVKSSGDSTDDADMDLAEPRRFEASSSHLPGHRKRRAGGLLMSASPIIMTIALLASALTINRCGAFGSGCEEFGSSTTTGQVLLFVAFGGALLFFIGLVLLAVGIAQRR